MNLSRQGKNHSQQVSSGQTCTQNRSKKIPCSDGECRAGNEIMLQTGRTVCALIHFLCEMLHSQPVDMCWMQLFLLMCELVI